MEMIVTIRKNTVDHIPSLILGVIIVASILMLFPGLSSGATFLGGWDTEWLVSQSGVDDSNLLVSTGTDTSKVVEISPYYLADPPVTYPLDPGDNPQDIIDGTGQPDWNAVSGDLSDHPLYPLVKFISDTVNIPEGTVWVCGAIFIIMALTLVGFVYAPNQLLTAFIGTLGTMACYYQGIMPFWTIFVYILIAFAIVLYERVQSF